MPAPLYIAAELTNYTRRERYRLCREAGLSRPEAMRWRSMRCTRLKRLLLGEYPDLVPECREDLCAQFLLLDTEYISNEEEARLYTGKGKEPQI